MITPERYERLDQLFAATCNLGPQERAELLDRECADDPSLRSDVDWLLANDADPSSFMESPALGDDFHLGSVPTPAEPDGSLVGQRISQYRLTRVIAAGGMGTVYEAVQDKPQRTVAVKVMRRGIASRSALRRFEYEAQILARLRHPGIAQVFEAGSSGDGPERGGVPYFVMEYVANAQPITEHAKTQGLTTRRRLELFAKVCDAVQHGHQRGIIHRDLKPGNILVDSSGEPKIIDFGVARATDSDMAVTTMQTDVGQLLGTLQYMSPEQCAANPHDLDTRTDVYSLGVVLYELLCERLPYHVTHAGVPEAVRVVREEVPPRPSGINYALRGDVETIVLKALEKDRSRRYQSASALAEDVQRYLTNQAILARPPSAMYQLNKLVARHKVPFTLIAALFVLAMGSSIWMTVLYGQAGAERDRAVDAEQLAERRLAEAQEARDEAREEKALAEAVYEFMHHMLTAIEPGHEMTVRDLLDQAAATIDEEFPDRPLVEAEVRNMIQAMYLNLGEYAHAEEHVRELLAIRREVLGEEDLQTLNAISSLAWVLKHQHHYKDAEQLYRRVADGRLRLLGQDHTGTLDALENVVLILNADGRSDEAEPLARELIEANRRVHGEGHWRFHSAVNALALILTYQGKLSEAEPLYKEGLQNLRRTHGDDFPQTLIAMFNLGKHLQDMDKPAEAEPLFREALELGRRVWGEAHRDTIRYMQGLAATMRRLGRFEEGEALYRQMLETVRSHLGDENSNTVWTMEGLAVYLQREKSRLPEAEPLLREVLAIRGRTQGEDDPGTIQAMHNLGWQLWKQGELAEAVTMYERVIERRRQLKGPDHQLTLYALDHYAGLLADLDRPSEAEEIFRQVLVVCRRDLGEVHWRTQRAMSNLGDLYTELGRYDEGETLLAEAVAATRAKLPKGHRRIGDYLKRYGVCLVGLQRYDDAETVLLEAHDTLKSAQGANHEQTTEAVRALADLYDAWAAAEPGTGHAEKAAYWRAKLPDSEADSASP